MFVVKRNGTKEEVSFDKILNRVKKLSDGLAIEPVIVAKKAIAGLYDGVTTRVTDQYLTETAAMQATVHSDYEKLAARLVISTLHKDTPEDFYEAYSILHKNQLVSDEFMSDVKALRKELGNIIDYSRDFGFSYFGVQTLKENRYLLGLFGEKKRNPDGTWSRERKTIERPQVMYLRVAVGIWGRDLERVKELYDLLSEGYYTHATPTLYNAGTPRAQMSSCFLVANKGDDIDGLYDTDKECAIISKNAGGVGLWVHNTRADGSIIKTSQGVSSGIVPMLRHIQATFRWINQGGKRKGSVCIYIEPWHADIFDFLELRKKTGDEERRCQDLFQALWVPDLFMQRVADQGSWTLFSPDEAPGLNEVWGQEFETLYTRYEEEGRGMRTIPAEELYTAITKAQKEHGMPFMVYKDAANRKSNQRHRGTIQSSNLCTEIIEYSSPTETAVCNLASINLKKYVRVPVVNGKKDWTNVTYDYEALRRISYIAAKNLDRVIDRNYYPTEPTRNSNMLNRPIGIGVQGLANVFMMFRIPFDSPLAREINRKIFETIYYGAMQASVDLAKELGAYPTYEGSPLSQGKFQFDLWDYTGPLMWDWESLRSKLKQYGARNSLLLAPMPTASTAQLMGNVEAFEMINNNMGKRETLAGEFIIINEHLVEHLTDLGLWDKRMADQIIANDGSVQEIYRIPEEVRAIYKTVWETSQRVIVDMAADRAVFICQSQSLNIHIANPTIDQIASLHMYTWRKGLKTGMYYLRTQASAKNVKVTVDVAAIAEREAAALACSLENPEACEMCS